MPSPAQKKKGLPVRPNLRVSVAHPLPGRHVRRVLFFFNDTATTEIYTLSLHDALPNSPTATPSIFVSRPWPSGLETRPCGCSPTTARSEEHTCELQSRQYLVCRLL